MKPIVCALLGLLLTAAGATEAFAFGAIVGPRGGFAYRGPYSAGFHGPNGGYAYRGPAGGAIVHTPGGTTAVRAPYRPLVTPGVATGVAVGVAVGAAVTAPYATPSTSYYPSPYYCPYGTYATTCVPQ